MNILVVEDDPLLAKGLKMALEQAGYAVLHAPNGCSAMSALQTHDFELLILDLGLPDIEGIEILRTLRGRGSSAPVLILTARDGVEQQVEALDTGADDYMEKPFDLRELEARVRALLRRGQASYRQLIKVASVAIDPFSRAVYFSGKRQDIPSREYEVLEALALESPHLVNKQRLAQRLAATSEDIGDNAVEVYIHRLRKRLNDTDLTISTARGVGYALTQKTPDTNKP